MFREDVLFQVCSFDDVAAPVIGAVEVRLLRLPIRQLSDVLKRLGLVAHMPHSAQQNRVRAQQLYQPLPVRLLAYLFSIAAFLSPLRQRVSNECEIQVEQDNWLLQVRTSTCALIPSGHASS